MKKILIPMVAMAFFAACSDTNAPTYPVASNPTAGSSSSSEALLPVGESSSSVAPVAGVSSSSVDVLGVSSSSVDALPAVSSSSNGAAQFTYSVPPLTAIDPTKSYSFYGAELTGRDQFKYGRFEARMKMAAISGTVSSMFVYYDDSWEKGEKPWNEIDIEVLGKAPDAWQSNIITREGDPSIKANTASESKPLHEFGFDATQDFHLYAIVWTPEYVSWEIDSVEVRRDEIGLSRGTHADADQVKFLTEEQSLRFNLWASKSAAWTGKWDGGIGLPIEQQIDYVRVYSYDEATKGFTVLWQDDFDGEDLDPKHWDRGNWEMERVNLRPDNVIVENGVCRLIMDYEAN
ncbi:MULTISPECIES: family 16 glycosylhydrolase [unclassified Fibrobacter]|jgi:hypothetical protein|uniref:family 16 glycosylhydrolase n=1 Tax=unclassified Fibrobacter TaxID=2634177 RepID=UPI0009117A9E|nr:MULTISPECIES: family 16 glycosylhydrolase [unclassified Fibrobacter]SHM20356.1 Glycosyl hydrolases family 16 [Fibrobacter sp. UWB7]SMG25487.1 Glycosyl hydrolases family 16 [Fibrobacter sp. UWB13]